MDSSNSIKSDDTDYNVSSISSNSSRNDADIVLEDIVQALHSWTNRILVLEGDLRSNSNLKRSVTDCLQGQVLDGLIKQQDANELQYILNLWINLHRAYSCKQIGADFADQEVLSNLLELYSLKQISKSFFIRVALELCRVES